MLLDDGVAVPVIVAEWLAICGLFQVGHWEGYRDGLTIRDPVERPYWPPSRLPKPLPSTPGIVGFQPEQGFHRTVPLARIQKDFLQLRHMGYPAIAPNGDDVEVARSSRFQQF